MNNTDTNQSTDGAPWAPLVDVSSLPLAPLGADTDGILGRSLRRILDGLHERDGVISSFGSAFPDD
jgi:FXSXX-COOH protein